MNEQDNTNLSPRDLLMYLDIAVKFRNHESNIQLLRNAIFTGLQAFLLACYGALVSGNVVAAFFVAFFGLILSVLWFRYYSASVYWYRFWEQRCNQINDYVKSEIPLKVGLFDGHPVNDAVKEAPEIFYGKSTIRYHSIHAILKILLIMVLGLWGTLLFLATFNVIILICNIISSVI